MDIVPRILLIALYLAGILSLCIFIVLCIAYIIHCFKEKKRNFNDI